MNNPQEITYTYADLLTWEDGIRYELYGGVPVALASPTDRHQLVLGELFRQLANYLVGKTCKAYLAPFDVRLLETENCSAEDVDTVLQPDLSIICDTAKMDTHGCKGAPDMVVEVLSPSTQRYDRFIKFSLYQKAGVKEYWIVDPDSRTVAVHLLEEGQYHSPVVYADGAQVSVAILDDCVVELRTLFNA